MQRNAPRRLVASGVRVSERPRAERGIVASDHKLRTVRRHAAARRGRLRPAHERARGRVEGGDPAARGLCHWSLPLSLETAGTGHPARRVVDHNATDPAPQLRRRGDDALGLEDVRNGADARLQLERVAVPQRHGAVLGRARESPRRRRPRERKDHFRVRREMRHEPRRLAERPAGDCPVAAPSPEPSSVPRQRVALGQWRHRAVAQDVPLRLRQRYGQWRGGVPVDW
mmetsp:Transcript_3131/g.9453  ORF Transcript_3131/g.9453 Transcript_3131/m.9453 type:complete len:228 (+) Transcript_3131:221-904(+)